MIPLFTNAVGNHQRSSSHTRGVTLYTNGSITSQKFSEGTYVSDSSYRPFIMKNKRVNGYYPASAYVRSGYHVTNDTPFRIHWALNQYLEVDTGDVTALAGAPVPESMFGTSMFRDISAQVATELLNKLRGNHSLQLGNDILEANKTLRMISQNVIPVARALQSARHGRWGAIPGILGLDKRDILNGKYPANKWLEYQYGWKPMLGSIYDGVQKLKEPPRGGYTLQARRTVKRHLSYTRTGYQWKSKIDADLLIQAIALYQVKDPFVDTLDGLGLLNPLSIGWEAVPFSFVFDWFVPVGNVLSAASATMGLSFRGGSYSHVGKGKEVRSIDPSQFSGRYTVVNPGSATAEFIQFERTRMSDFPLPQFYHNPSPFSTTHVTSALALLRQLFR